MDLTPFLNIRKMADNEADKPQAVNDALDDIDAGLQEKLQGLNAYDIAGGADGKPAASAVIARFVAARAFSLPIALSGSRAKADAAATASATFSVRKNGGQIGTFTFAAGAMSATFAATSTTNFAAGDVLTVVAPGAADAALSDVAFTLAGVTS